MVLKQKNKVSLWLVGVLVCLALIVGQLSTYYLLDCKPNYPSPSGMGWLIILDIVIIGLFQYYICYKYSRFE